MRILLVQCCHPPQFVFLAQRIAARHPGAELWALVWDTARNRARLGDLSLFQRVIPSAGDWPEEASQCDVAVFPLVERGYRKMKRLRRRAGDKARASGWDGDLRPLGEADLPRWQLRRQDPPRQFNEFMKSWPPLPLSGRVLFVESRSRLAGASMSRWRQYLDGADSVVRVREGSLLAAWRRFRGGNFAAAVTFFTVEDGFRPLRLLPFLLRVPRVIVVDEGGIHDIESARHLARYFLRRWFEKRTHPPYAPKVLFMQTEVPDYVVHAVRRMRRLRPFRRADVSVLCREADHEELCRRLPDCRVIPHGPGRRPSDAWRLWRKARAERADVLAANFTGRGVFRPYKAVFFALNVRRRLAFNASLEAYPLTVRSLPRVFRKEKLLFGASPVQPDRILLVQTDDLARMRKVLGRLRDPKVAGKAPVAVLCNEERREDFESLAGVDEVVCYRKGDFWGNLKLFWKLRRRQADVAVALFSGRPTFQLPKLAFLLLSARNKLIFNSHLECYYLGLRTWPLVFKPQREDAAALPHKVLLIQTEDDETMLEAIKTVHSPEVAKVSKLLVYCRQDKRTVFQEHPRVDGVVTYVKGQHRANWKKIRSLKPMGLDCAAAVLSGRPVFRLQKLLFFLAPARHRLVINENQDCFYFRWTRLGELLSMHQRRKLPLAALAARGAAKIFLFLPRFFYLVIWLTYMRARRAYTLKLEEAPERK